MLLIPFLAAVSLVRLGLRPALVWIVPVVGLVLGKLVAGMVTIALPMNLPGAVIGQPLDLLPSGSPDLLQILSILFLEALAVGLGLWLGQRSPRNIKTGQARLKR